MTNNDIKAVMLLLIKIVINKKYMYKNLRYIINNKKLTI